MDKRHQDLEDRLAGLMPRAVSDEGTRRLEAEIDRLAAETNAGARGRGKTWIWAGAGAAACLAWGVATLPWGEQSRPVVADLPEENPAIELVSLSRQVTGVTESDWIMGDGVEPPVRIRSYEVTGTEEFYDDESGLSVTVISESEERVPIVLTQL